MTKPSEYKRRKLVVDVDVQSELVRQLIYNWLMFLITLFAILSIVEFVKSGLTLGVGECFAAVVHDNLVVLISLFVLAPIAIYQMVKVSHRFVGPIVKLRSAMARLGGGESVEPIYFRKNDFWKDIALNFNRVTTRIETLEAVSQPIPPELETAEVG